MVIVFLPTVRDEIQYILQFSLSGYYLPNVMQIHETRRTNTTAVNLSVMTEVSAVL